MAVIGVGVDVVDVSRFEASLARTPGLKERLFTPEERDVSVESLAARFAAKEAVAKALGAPAGLSWHDAEVVRTESGQPTLRVTGTVAQAAEAAQVRSWHVSLSHDGGHAVAVVVADGGPA